MTERAHKEARLLDDEYGRDHFTDENMDNDKMVELLLTLNEGLASTVNDLTSIIDDMQHQAIKMGLQLSEEMPTTNRLKKRKIEGVSSSMGMTLEQRKMVSALNPDGRLYGCIADFNKLHENMTSLSEVVTSRAAEIAVEREAAAAGEQQAQATAAPAPAAAVTVTAAAETGAIVA